VRHYRNRRRDERDRLEKLVAASGIAWPAPHARSRHRSPSRSAPQPLARMVSMITNILPVFRRQRRNRFLGGHRLSQSGQQLQRFGLLAVAAVSLLAAFLVTAAAQAQVVALGASNTEGYGVSASEAFPARLETMLDARGYNVSVSNAGVSGDTSAGILSRVDSAVPRGTKVVILAVFGYNDARRGVSPAEHHANVAATVSKIRTLGAKVISVDLSGLPRQSDGLHLTAEGHATLAARLLPQVTGALGRAIGLHKTTLCCARGAQKRSGA